MIILHCLFCFISGDRLCAHCVPTFPSHLHDNHSINLRQSTVIVGKIEPHESALILKLESEVIVTWHRELSLDIVQSHIAHAFIQLEEVQLVQQLIVLRNVVEDRSRPRLCH